MQIEKLSAAKIEQALEKADALCSKICDALIACGRGHERHSDIVIKNDALSLKYAAAFDARRPILAEIERRKYWHGSLKPIKVAA